MRIEKQSRYDRFTITPNDLLERSDLSFKAKGLLMYLISRPDGWDLDSVSLAQQGPDGRDAIRSGLTELERVGYVERVKRQGAGGRWETITIVRDTPIAPGTDFPAPVTGDGFSGVGNPTVGFPGAVVPNTEINTQQPTVVAPAQTEMDIPVEPKAETAGQRTNRVARTYTDRVPLSNFLAVRGVVAKAMKANYAEERIVEALSQLADDGRTVTTDTLRYQLDGFPAARQTPRRETASDRARSWAATAQDVSALFSPPREAIGS